MGSKAQDSVKMLNESFHSVLVPVGYWAAVSSVLLFATQIQNIKIVHTRFRVEVGPPGKSPCGANPGSSQVAGWRLGHHAPGTVSLRSARRLLTTLILRMSELAWFHAKVRRCVHLQSAGCCTWFFPPFCG